MRIKKDKSWGAEYTKFIAQFFPNRVLHIQAEDNQLAGVLIFDPIHDGLGGDASQSIGRLEFEQYWLSGTNLAAHFRGCLVGCLYRAQEKPAANHDPNDQHEEQDMLPADPAAQQITPGDPYNDQDEQQS